MAWPMPDRQQLRNILYYSGGGFRGSGTPRQHLIHSARVAQCMVVLNRARQEVSSSPGWGAGHGTEHATDHPNPDPEILTECDLAAGEALTIYRQIPPGELYGPLNMYGAQLFRHSREVPGVRWPDTDNTHLIAAYGPMLSPEQVAACEAHMRRGEPHRNVCNGYLSIYVNFNWLGRAMAAERMHRRPTEVPQGPEMREGIRAAGAIDWDSLMHRYSS